MATTTPHTVTSFDEDLHRLRTIVSQMGALAESQLAAALDALIERDADAALAVVALDGRFDALQGEAEWTAVTTLSRNAPLADDLREVLAGIKIAGWLERAGDYAKGVARRSAALAVLPSVDTCADVAALGEQARDLLRSALAAYLDRDEDKATDVISSDTAADAAYTRLFHALAATTNGLAAAHLQLVSKNFERIGDLATNIAEQVIYVARGGRLPARPTGDRAEENPSQA